MPQPSGNSQEEIEQKQQNALYDNLHGQERSAQEARNYDEALRLALQRQQLRDGPNVQASINWIRGQIAWRRGDTHTALNYLRATLSTWPDERGVVRDLEQRAAAADLAAQQARDAALQQQQLQQQTSAAVSSLMDTAVAHGGSTATPPGLGFKSVGSGASRTDQLTNAASSGADANRLGISDEEAKFKSNCTFDTSACGKTTSIDINKVRAIGQTPSAAELSAHIPDAGKNDRQIQQSMAYYQKLDSQKIDTQAKLAAVKQQIDSGAGDAQGLNAQQATLNNDLKRYNADQKKTQDQIKKRLVAINVPWTESPAPATGTSASQ